MKIGILVKQVPSTDTRVRIAGSDIEQGDIKWIVNPYDEFAYEQALQLKKETGGQVVVFTLGPKRAEESLRHVLAVGADEAVHLNEGFTGSDHSGIARSLAAAAKAKDCQVIFAGKLAVDDGAAQVPQMVAENLGWSCVTNITSYTHEGETALVSQPLGGGASVSLRAAYPAVFSCDKGLNDPRFPNIRGIVSARRKKIEAPSPADLGVDGVGDAGATTSVSTLAYPAERPAGQMVSGATAAEKAAELVRLLHNEAKVL